MDNGKAFIEQDESESAPVHAKRKQNITIPIAIVFYFLGVIQSRVTTSTNIIMYKEDNKLASVQQSFHHNKHAVCDTFTRYYNDNESGGCGTLTALRFTEGGRLGNLITKSAKMISYAIENNCRFELQMMVPRTTTLEKSCFVPTTNTSAIGRDDICNMPDHDWYYHGVDKTKLWGTNVQDQSLRKNEFYDLTRQYYSDCAVKLLSLHLEINETHAFGKACPSPNSYYSVLHIRSGDIFAGHYDRIDGTYHKEKVNPLYIPYPTSYYLAVVRGLIAKHTQSNGEGPHQIFVLCEDIRNPTCEYFKKATAFNSQHVQIIFRLNQPLLDDLGVLMCASNVAVSIGTFQVVLHLSQHLITRHSFSSTPKNCTIPNEHFYWIANETERDNYDRMGGEPNAIYPWGNTAYQRHLVDKHYEVASCEPGVDGVGHIV